jgi:hypothetical protein
MIARALNQKAAPHLPSIEFLGLAQEIGCVGVEPRNDLGRPLFDGIDPAEAGSIARSMGIRLVGMCEVNPINDWSDERARAVEALISVTVASGAESFSLIPRVDGREVEDGVRQRALRAAMREVLPMLVGRNIVALIEPVGFASSSLSAKAELVEAIEAVGGKSKFRMVTATAISVSGYEPSQMRIEDTGLGMSRSSKFVLLEVLSRPRGQAAKVAFYKNLTSALASDCDIGENDVMISFVKNSDEDWSFGNGRAQFLTGEL